VVRIAAGSFDRFDTDFSQPRKIPVQMEFSVGTTLASVSKVSDPSKPNLMRGLADLGNSRFFRSETTRADGVRRP
jgi:hypothetical protein